MWRRAVGTAIDGRTTRHLGYAISQQKRKLIEQVFRLDENRRRAGAAVSGRRTRRLIVTFTAAVHNDPVCARCSRGPREPGVTVAEQRGGIAAERTWKCLWSRVTFSSPVRTIVPVVRNVATPSPPDREAVITQRIMALVGRMDDSRSSPSTYPGRDQTKERTHDVAIILEKPCRARRGGGDLAMITMAAYVGLAKERDDNEDRGSRLRAYTIGLFGDMPYNALGRAQYPRCSPTSTGATSPSRSSTAT